MRIHSLCFFLCLAVPALLVSGCAPVSKAGQPAPPPPAKVENAKKESDLTIVELTDEAVTRLGIVAVPVVERDVPRALDLGGEVVVPPDRIVVVAAPLAGTLDTSGMPSVGQAVKKGQPLLKLAAFLPPERDLRVQLERDVTSLTERRDAAKLRKDRAEALANEKAGSVRDAERAREEFTVLETELKAARERLDRFDRAPLASGQDVAIQSPIAGMVRRVQVGPGQVVSAGTPLLEIVSLETLWLRVPVFVGDLDGVARRESARVHGLAADGGSSGTIARPVSAPPTADPVAATADLYYLLPNGNGTLRPGQRLGVTLPLTSRERGLTVPWSAVIHDVNGGAWVYERTSPRSFVRRPVEIRSVSDGIAVLGRGPKVGTNVVSVGVAELFGTEFGAGK